MKRGCLGQIRRDHSRCPVDSVRGRRSRANCGEANAMVQVREDGASGQGVGAGGGESGRIGLYLEAFTFKSISLLGGTGKVPSPFSSVTHPMTPYCSVCNTHHISNYTFDSLLLRDCKLPGNRGLTS